MTGEGNGGGGGVFALLVLWIIGSIYVLNSVDFDAAPSAEAAEPTDAVAGLTPVGSVPGSADLGFSCDESGLCEGEVTRATVAAAIAEALDLPATSDDYFGDDDGTPHEDAINRLAAAGGTEGCDASTFCVDRVADRQTVAAYLARVLELPDADVDHFDDDNGTMHEAHINALADAGIVRGCGERSFCPADPIPWSSVEIVLNRAAELPQVS